MRLIFLFLFSLNLFALDIDDLKTSFEKDGAFVAGKILTKLNNGLHFLEEERDFQNTLLIAIHGRGTEGYEWVYPLINLDKKNNRLSFYRWNTIGCPNEAIRKISLEIDRLKEKYKKIVMHERHNSKPFLRNSYFRYFIIIIITRFIFSV